MVSTSCKPAAEDLGCGRAHGLGEARGEESAAKLGVGLPDPVRGGVCDITEAGLARLQRIAGALGIGEHPISPKEQRRERESQDWEHIQERGGARSGGAPDQVGKMMTVGREKRQRSRRLGPRSFGATIFRSATRSMGTASPRYEASRRLANKIRFRSPAGASTPSSLSGVRAQMAAMATCPSNVD